ncbi:MAG: 30S ribosomal protein S3, partial [Propionicimonas sp.]|nr:30S ribosomal protein S3 [Propionicimonas sp.]
ERAAQKAARQAAGGRARPARGPRREGAGGRPDRPERGGRRRAEAVAEGAAPEAAVSENAGA